MFRRYGPAHQSELQVDPKLQFAPTKLILDVPVGVDRNLVLQLIQGEVNQFMFMARQQRSLSPAGSGVFSMLRRSQTARYQYASIRDTDTLTVTLNPEFTRLLQQITVLQQLNVCFFVDLMIVEESEFVSSFDIDVRVTAWPERSLEQRSTIAAGFYTSNPNPVEQADYFDPENNTLITTVFAPPERYVRFAGISMQTRVYSVSATPGGGLYDGEVDIGTPYRLLVNMSREEHDRFFAQENVKIGITGPNQGSVAGGFTSFYRNVVKRPELFVFREAPTSEWGKVSAFGLIGAKIDVRQKNFVLGDDPLTYPSTVNPPVGFYTVDMFHLESVVLTGIRNGDGEFFPFQTGHATIRAESTHYSPVSASSPVFYEYFQTYPLVFPPKEVVDAVAADARAAAIARVSGQNLKVIDATPFPQYGYVPLENDYVTV